MSFHTAHIAIPEGKNSNWPFLGHMAILEPITALGVRITLLVSLGSYPVWQLGDGGLGGLIDISTRITGSIGR